jgi:hypothetical protein
MTTQVACLTSTAVQWTYFLWMESWLNWQPSPRELVCVRGESDSINFKFIPANLIFPKTIEGFLCHGSNRYGLILFIMLRTFHWKCVLWTTSSEYVRWIMLHERTGMSLFNNATMMIFCQLSRNVLQVVDLLCLLGIKEFCIFYSVHYTPQNGYKIREMSFFVNRYLQPYFVTTHICPLVCSSVHFAAT